MMLLPKFVLIRRDDRYDFTNPALSCLGLPQYGQLREHVP